MVTAAPPISSARGEAPSQARGRVILFDYSFSYELRGNVDTLHSKTVTVSIEGPFTAVSIGYGIVPRSMPLSFGPGKPEDFGGLIPSRTALKIPIPFQEVPFGAVVNSFVRAARNTPRFLKGEGDLNTLLTNGFRIRRELVGLITGTNGAASLDADTLERLFEVVASPPDQVPFLYALHDEGTGRAFQSEPILSIAGLGISNGDRPFRQLATPITFAPQTTIRLDVTEKSEFQGQLFVSLQGYKVLGGPGTPTGSYRR